MAPLPPAPPAGCAPSALNYACSQTLGKIVLHWSIGGTAAPENLCTGIRPLLDGAGQAAAADQEGQLPLLVHFAVEAATRGYVSLGFPESPARMYNADMVLGWVDDEGRGHVGTYYVTSYTMTERELVQPSWVLGAGVVEGRVPEVPGGTPAAQRTVLCFSRRAAEARARASPLLLGLDIVAGPAAEGSRRSGRSRRRLQQQQAEGMLRYSWAISPEDRLVEHPADSFGAGLLDAGSGTASETKIKDRRAAIRAHGVLMSVAWALLLPLGTLVPAHRWVLAGRVWRGKALWFWMHMGMQVAGLATFLAGLLVGFLNSPKTLKGTTEVSHAVLGYVAIGLSGLQLLAGFLRPDPSSHLRKLWALSHTYLGRGLILLCWANVYIGIMAFHRSVYAEAVAQWAAPLAAVMGLMVCADAVLVLMARPSKMEGKEKDFPSIRNDVQQGVLVQGSMAAGSHTEGFVEGQELAVRSGPQAAGIEVAKPDLLRYGSTFGTGMNSLEVGQTSAREAQADDVRVMVMLPATQSAFGMR